MVNSLSTVIGIMEPISTLQKKRFVKNQTRPYLRYSSSMAVVAYQSVLAPSAPPRSIHSSASL